MTDVTRGFFIFFVQGYWTRHTILFLSITKGGEASRLEKEAASSKASIVFKASEIELIQDRVKMVERN